MSTSSGTRETAPVRDRADRCPGVLRPWPAEDGSLVRIRVVAGRLSVEQLSGLVALAQEYGDGDVHLTTRANVQIRGLAQPVPEGFVAGVRALGLLPSDAHERVRNIVVSPFTGLLGGRADVRPVAAALDRALLADEALAALPGRFLFALDDGRGDLHDRPADLGAVVLDGETAQLRIGEGYGAVVRLADVAEAVADLARTFLAVRGVGETAAWHVSELDALGVELRTVDPDPRAVVRTEMPALDQHRQDDGGWALHVGVPDGRLTPELAGDLLALARTHVVVTPWRSVVVPDLEEA